MTKYPYSEPEAYPMTPARRAYIDQYNTRLVTAETPSIDTVLTSTAGFISTQRGGDRRASERVRGKR
jgi:hypothetical protein